MSKKLKLIKMLLLGDIDYTYDFDTPSIIPLSLGVLSGSLRSKVYTSIIFK